MVKFGTPMFASSGHVAQVDETQCIACATCEDTCPFGAIEVDDMAVVNWDSCMGCRVCIGQCPNEAMSLVRDERKGVPLDVRLMAHQRYSILKHDIYNIEDSLIARAGDVLTPKFMKFIDNKAKYTNRDYKPIFQHKGIRDDLMAFIEEQPYNIIFESPRVIDQTLRWMRIIMFPPAAFEALDFFKKNDPYTYRYILCVSALTVRMVAGLIRNRLKLLKEVSVAPMHDFGKITIPSDILRKVSYLTRKEKKILQDHAAAGFVLLSYYLGNKNILSPKVAHEHHERMDRSGYPRGIKLADKMVELVAVCDIFDALISPRPYRDVPYDTRSALELICKQATLGKVGWDIVRLLISYNRRDKSFYKGCIISREKRGKTPKGNRYGVVVDDPG